MPGNFLIEFLYNLRTVEIIHIPQTLLPNRGIEAQLKHIPIPIRKIAARRMPYIRMPEKHRARFANRLHLSYDILIALDLGFVNPPKLRAGHKKRTPALERCIFWKKGNLNIEMQIANIVFGILMQIGTFARICRREMRRVMIVSRIGTHQTVNNRRHFGQAKNLANGFIGPGLAKRRTHRSAASELTRAHLIIREFAKFPRHQIVKTQKTLTCELGHFYGRKQKILIHVSPPFFPGQIQNRDNRFRIRARLPAFSEKAPE